MQTYHHPLDVLGDPTRRRVYERLRDGPLAVSEIAASLPVSRPAVSQHLRILEEARLVTHRKEGARNLYEVDPDGLAALRMWVEGFWSDVLSRFAQAAEEERRKE